MFFRLSHLSHLLIKLGLTLFNEKLKRSYPWNRWKWVGFPTFLSRIGAQLPMNFLCCLRLDTFSIPCITLFYGLTQFLYRDSRVDKLKSQIFILSCTQRRYLTLPQTTISYHIACHLKRKKIITKKTKRERVNIWWGW